MKISWAKIENFRSIIDSRTIYFNAGVTVLAGKNESGKSNILRALECFSKDEFSDSDYPQGLSDEHEPQVTVCFIVNKEDLQHVHDLSIESNANFELIIIRSAVSEQRIYGSAYDILTKEIYKILEDLKFSINDKVKNLLNFLGKSPNSAPKTLLTNDSFLKSTKESITIARAEISNLGENRVTEIEDLIQQIDLEIFEIQNMKSEIEECSNKLTSLIPNFILFDSFDDILSDYVTIE